MVVKHQNGCQQPLTKQRSGHGLSKLFNSIEREREREFCTLDNGSHVKKYLTVNLTLDLAVKKANIIRTPNVVKKK
jgi:hypothetical protein